MKTTTLIALLFTAMFGVMGIAFAQAGEVPVEGFISQLLQVVSGLGGMSGMAKLAAILTLIISSMKVSFLKPLWDKVGSAKVWVAPVLSLIVGIVSLEHITGPGILVYLSAGVGSIAIHEVLDLVKKIPGLGPIWVSIISMISSLLGGKGK